MFGNVDVKNDEFVYCRECGIVCNKNMIIIDHKDNIAYDHKKNCNVVLLHCPHCGNEEWVI
jgi:Pyruvate/2-oxoacid:ferredoxin oxidoreductase delta subunit